MTGPVQQLSAPDHAAYHAAMCLAEAVNKIRAECSRDFPTDTPPEIIERIQGVRKFADSVLNMTNEAIDIAGMRR